MRNFTYMFACDGIENILLQFYTLFKNLLSLRIQNTEFAFRVVKDSQNIFVAFIQTQIKYFHMWWKQLHQFIFI